MKKLQVRSWARKPVAMVVHARHFSQCTLTCKGPEILNDLAGTKLDYWVTGYGTGGTFHGAGKYIKANSPDTTIVLAEPGT